MWRGRPPGAGLQPVGGRGGHGTLDAISGICYWPNVITGCNYNFNAGRMDSLELRAVSSEWRLESSTGAWVLRTEYAGTLNHVTGFGKTRYELHTPQEQSRTGIYYTKGYDTRCETERMAYALTGWMEYDTDRQWIGFSFEGRLQGQPRYEHAPSVTVVGGENVPFDLLGVSFRWGERRPGSAGEFPDRCDRPLDEAIGLLLTGRRDQPAGFIVGRVEPKGTAVTINRATVELFLAGDEDGDPQQVTRVDGGTFEFLEVPATLPGSKQPAVYSLRVSGAQADVPDQREVFNTSVLYFAPDGVDGVRPFSEISPNVGGGAASGGVLPLLIASFL